MNYSRADFDVIRKEVKKTRWNLQGSASEAWDDFKMKLLDIEDRLIPKVRAGVRKKKATWMNHKAVRAVKTKHKVYTRYKRADHPAYVKAEKEAKQEVEKARRTFENKLANNIKSDVKSFFAYARSKSKAKSRVDPLEDETGMLVKIRRCVRKISCARRLTITSHESSQDRIQLTFQGESKYERVRTKKHFVTL